MAIVSKVFVKGTRPHSKNEAPTWKEGTVANTLNTFDLRETRCNELVCESKKVTILNFQGSKGNSIAEESNAMYTLNAMHGHDVHCVVDVVSWKKRDRLAPIMHNMTGTLAASDYKGTSFVGYMENPKNEHDS